MRVPIHRMESCRHVATSLVKHSYLRTTLEEPSLAVSLRTLELYYRIRRRRASFSIEAFAKVLCDLYKIPYHRRYRDGLSNAFDVYLHILRIVDKRVAKELGHDEENWRVLNACPPCTYVLINEPPLQFSRMIVFDGNNSLKRVGPKGTMHVGDTRTYEDSDYYLSTQFVDQYADEVKKSGAPEPSDSIRTAPSSNQDNGDPVSGDADGDAGDPTDGINPTHVPCAENWKAAASSVNKKMWAIFDESGIFASACRHGFILWICDMIRTGELAKYGLAHLAKALKVFPPRLLLAYDIGCVFEGTVNRSSLGPLFRERQGRCCVNAFHGYSHNFLCQVQNHPNIIKGMGLEDLETLERVFSASNQVASVTRYMSKYRRRVYIDLFLHQWDEERYENLGNMIYNNYKQALQIINVDAPELEHAMQQFGIHDADLEEWEKYKSANNLFLISTPDDASTDSYASALCRTRKRETERRYADERRDQLICDVIQLEEKLGIARAQRWTFSSPKFLSVTKYISHRKYEQALDKLQKLVIQRLFELQKLNLSHT
ncbi:hypothetical protein C0992_008628, partial [Termitomyces sp. T32_za158]